jgi:hypothetical protein
MIPDVKAETCEMMYIISMGFFLGKMHSMIMCGKGSALRLNCVPNTWLQDLAAFVHIASDVNANGESFRRKGR